jgi:hypothetical protein
MRAQRNLTRPPREFVFSTNHASSPSRGTLQIDPIRRRATPLLVLKGSSKIVELLGFDGNTLLTSTAFAMRRYALNSTAVIAAH